MAANLVLLALVIICLPFSNTVWMLAILIMVQGFLFSTSMTGTLFVDLLSEIYVGLLKLNTNCLFYIIAGVYAYTACLWAENYAKALNFVLPLVFIGKMIPSPLVLPFLSSYENSTFMDVGSRMPSQEHYEVHKHMKDFQYQGRIFYPFLICALLILGAAIPMAVTYFLFRDKSSQLSTRVQPPTEPKDSNNQTDSTFYTVMVTFCLAFLCMIAIIPFHGSGDYFFSISLSKELRMSKESAGTVSAVNQIMAVIGNIGTIFVLHCISTPVYFNMALFSTMMTLTVATLFGLKSEIVFWITTCLFTFLHLPTMCTFSAYVEHFLSPTGRTLGIIQIGYGLGRILMNIVTGFLFQRYGSRMVLLEFTAIIGLALLISLGLLVFKKLYLAKRDKGSNINDDIRHPLFQSDEE